MLTCRDVADFLGEYLDRTLPWRQRLIFQLHLALCRDCRRYLDTYRQTITAVQSLGSPPCDAAADVPVPDALVQAILAARRQYLNELDAADSDMEADLRGE